MTVLVRVLLPVVVMCPDIKMLLTIAVLLVAVVGGYVALRVGSVSLTLALTVSAVGINTGVALRRVLLLSCCCSSPVAAPPVQLLMEADARIAPLLH